MDGFFRVVMLDGTAVSVSNADGQVELTEPNAGTVVTGPNDPPGDPAPWGGDRLARAIATVTFGAP